MDVFLLYFEFDSLLGLLWGRLGANPEEVPGGHQWQPASTTPWRGRGWGVKFDMLTRQIANQNAAWRGENIYFYPFLVGASWRREPWRQPRGDKLYEIQNWHWVPNFSCLEMMETWRCRGWSRSSWKLDRGVGCPPRSSKTDSFCSDPKKFMDTLLVACAMLNTKQWLYLLICDKTAVVRLHRRSTPLCSEECVATMTLW